MASFYSSSSGAESDTNDNPISRPTAAVRQEVDMSFRNLDVESLTVQLCEQWLPAPSESAAMESRVLEPHWTVLSSPASQPEPDEFTDIEGATSLDEEDDVSSGAWGENDTVVAMKFAGNSLDTIPPVLARFTSLRHLDLSNNRVSVLSDKVLRQLRHLARLNLKNNSLSDASFQTAEAFPPHLKELNLSGNFLTRVPSAVLDLPELKYLYLGRNMINWIPPSIKKLKSLVILYLGGNELKSVPEEIGELTCLQALILCDNAIGSIPWTVCKLTSLYSLLLHNNQLQTLPREILGLQMLSELSLRDNPLVLRFVRDMTYDPPSLLELAARVVKVNKIPYTDRDLAWNLREYLSTAKSCVNPKCQGVYFDTRVENIKFVDFCGKYRIPLLEFLCSTNCTRESRYRRPRAVSVESDDEVTVPVDRMKKVLLG